MSELTEPERLTISAVVHQNYYMPDVFATVEQILDWRMANAVRVTHHRCCQDGEQCRVHAAFLDPALRTLGRLDETPPPSVLTRAERA